MVIICKARIKQLITARMPDIYIRTLPASPVQLLRDWPDVAQKVFSAAAPPVSSPFNEAAIRMVRSKIVMRGGRASVPVPGATAESSQMQLMTGSNMHMPVCSKSAVTTALDRTRALSLPMHSIACLARKE